ncbi:MAG: hypothetical protein EBR62_03855 [Verrucomicrobia bacterium]|nr:hypothetical protein [Verrucomicrobiota bacterium]
MSNALTVPNYQVADMERMAKAFAASKLFGVQNLDQALALMLVAQAEGRHPASAAQDYNIIQGRPAKKADAMLRDFLSAGGKVEWHALTDDKADATFSHPAGGSARIDWTLERARAAGITNPMWKKYPRQMLRSRAVSEGVRTVCPGATSGMYVPEEVQDIVHVEPAPPVAVETAPVMIEGDFTAPKQRKSGAQAKRDGDHDRIIGEINTLSKEGLADWLTNFDAYTAELPLSWLDPMRDKLELRRQELFAPHLEAEAEMDEGFRAAVGAAA